MAYYAVLVAFVLFPASHCFWYPTVAPTSGVQSGKDRCHPSPGYCAHTHPWKHVWAYKADGDRCVHEWTQLCGYGHTSSDECRRHCVGRNSDLPMCGHVRCHVNERCVYGQCVHDKPSPGPPCGSVHCEPGESCRVHVWGPPRCMCGYRECGHDERCVPAANGQAARCEAVAPSPPGPVCGHVRCEPGERCESVSHGDWRVQLTCVRGNANAMCGHRVCHYDEKCIDGYSGKICIKVSVTPVPVTAPPPVGPWCGTQRCHAGERCIHGGSNDALRRVWFRCATGDKCGWRPCRIGERCVSDGWHERCQTLPAPAPWPPAPLPHPHNPICSETYETDNGGESGYVCSSIIKVVYNYDRQRCDTIGYCVDVSPSRNRFNTRDQCEQACG